MKAAIYEQFRSPPSVAEVPDPVPRSEGGVLQVQASGVCRSDWQGWMGHDSVFGAQSQIGYRNPEVHRLLDEARNTVDLEQLDRIYDRIIEQCIEDVPVTFLAIQVVYVVAHRRVRGFPPVLTKYPMAYIEDLWIEEEK